MKTLMKTLLCCAVLTAGACTSGKENPVDSHPGSGSVKESSKPVQKSSDTSRKDSITQGSANQGTNKKQ
jgi:hypothetical protein